MESIFQVLASSEFGVYSAIAIVIVPYLLRKNQAPGEIQSVVTSLGLLGTFAGILAGLYFFDTTDIDKSIPSLLGGLKTAFYTSVAGVFASVLIQIYPKVYGMISDKTDENKSSEELLSNVVDELKLLNSNISGDNDTTLVSQMKFLRADLTKKQDELNTSFKEFADKMAENNSKALIEALEGVMRDFNTKINEQFGDNFKQLNEAVGRILVWQVNYKNQIETATQVLNASAVALDASSESLGNSAETMRVASTHAAEFSALATKLEEQLETMGGFLGGIKTLSETISGSGEQIKREMDGLIKKNLESLALNSERIGSEMDKLTKQNLDMLSKSGDEIRKQLELSTNSNLSALSKSGDEISKKMLDVTTKSLEGLGVNLISISEKLATDYQSVQQSMAAIARANK